MFWNKKEAAQSYDRLEEEFDEKQLEGVNTGFKQTRKLDRESALTKNEEIVYEEEGKVVEKHKKSKKDWDYQDSIEEASKVVKGSRFWQR